MLLTVQHILRTEGWSGLYDGLASDTTANFFSRCVLTFDNAWAFGGSRLICIQASFTSFSTRLLEVWLPNGRPVCRY